MGVNKELLGLGDNEGEVYAIEELVFSIQLCLQKAMIENGISNKELAERLGMTPARVSQIFADKGPNLTLKTIGRIIHALGEDFEFVKKVTAKKSTASVAEFPRAAVVSVNGASIWKERAANDCYRSNERMVA